MQRPVSGFNQDEFEKLAKEQEKSHKKLTQTANASRVKSNKIVDKIKSPTPNWAKTH